MLSDLPHKERIKFNKFLLQREAKKEDVSVTYNKISIINDNKKDIIMSESDIPSYNDFIDAVGYARANCNYSNICADRMRKYWEIIGRAGAALVENNNSHVTEELLWTKCFQLATQYYIQHSASQELLTNYSFMIDDINELTKQYYDAVKEGIKNLNTR